MRRRLRGSNGAVKTFTDNAASVTRTPQRVETNEFRHKSSARDFNTERVQAFLAGSIVVLDFDDADARAAGEVRALLEREGRPVGAYDVQLAGQAVRRGLTLVTANTREFDRVDDLRWENWSDWH